MNALSTTLEGEPDELWPLVRAMHEATLGAGAESVVTVVKFAQHADPAGQPTIASLTGKFGGADAAEQSCDVRRRRAVKGGRVGSGGG